jgi:hypothetical protein
MQRGGRTPRRAANETHVAPHDPKAKLYRTAQTARVKLHHLGHVLIKHRTGLPVDVEVIEPNGFAERHLWPRKVSVCAMQPVNPNTEAPEAPSRAGPAGARTLAMSAVSDILTGVSTAC